MKTKRLMIFGLLSSVVFFLCEKKLRYIILLVCVFTFQVGFSQIRTSVSTGTGIVSYGNLMGVGVDNDFVISLKPYISCGLNLGLAMSSDKNFNSAQVGAFNQNSIYFGNLNLYLNPKIYKSLELIVFGGGGIRHQNSTQILVNSNSELIPSNEFATGIGFNGGIGINYILNHYIVGIKYKHDFYKEGFDYFGLNFGIKVN